MLVKVSWLARRCMSLSLANGLCHKTAEPSGALVPKAYGKQAESIACANKWWPKVIRWMILSGFILFGGGMA